MLCWQEIVCLCENVDTVLRCHLLDSQPLPHPDPPGTGIDHLQGDNFRNTSSSHENLPYIDNIVTKDINYLKKLCRQIIVQGRS